MIAFLLLLLCGLQGTVLALRGYCTASQCYAIFLGATNFKGAQNKCQDFNGNLLLFLDVEEQGHLLTDLRGSFWYGSPEANVQNCTSFSVWEGENVTTHTIPCGNQLDGYFCQYPNADPCGAIPGGADAQVMYTAPMGFVMNTSRHFPVGTLALAQKTPRYPDAKYLCFESSWLKAPWNCEVLDGGCEQSCNSTSGTCACPHGVYLHANLISCSDDPCDRCAHKCHRPTRACDCHAGYELDPDGKSCVDVDECEEMDVCVDESEECVNIPGHFKCTCRDGFDLEEGKCVDVRICAKCEHMKCVKSNGVYACECGEGFKVSPQDPTKCVMYCDQQDCLANCISNPDLEERDMHQCFCPDGYINDIRNKTAYCTDINECEIQAQCEHNCENLFGSFVCSCNEGYELFDEYMCVHPDEPDWTPSEPAKPDLRPATLPSYVKAGSILGIIVFVLLCLVLLYFLIRNLAKRCGSLELASLKGPDMDIFYLQQVTTETYKRLSFDKQSRCDSQRL
ncbi:thrombomodulin-like [Corythoichthys intestinalis]|uniref:thrombomodulin-like n=1 Tax=Corythoichthys intestinalis TaxID=161448 RepID=UPI0025A50DAF|nr:thrombomodulin-like [Corythoichthys intestinalis]XP_061806242.1 thrombomodulin-like [Nerophis lumbriciformis]